MTITLDAIRACLEGLIPGTMATCSQDGTPNVSYLSQVHYVDQQHVALSYQFFNKTRTNLLENPHAVVAVIDPFTAAHYRISIEFLHTETRGPIFESMKAHLSGIASHVGMAGVFRLLGADIFRVVKIERVPGNTLPQTTHRPNLLAAARAASERLGGLAQLDQLEQLLNGALATVEELFGIEHSIVLLYDAMGQRLFTVTSRGYEDSGVGSEIALGDGIIGVAARERTPIRIGHMTAEYSYNRAIRANSAQPVLDMEIPLPGLADSRSQLAIPLQAGPMLVGVLYMESAQDLHFGYDEEDALVTFGAQLAMSVHVLQSLVEDAEPAPIAFGAALPEGDPVLVRHFPENDSVFLDDDYLIKGVAGSIFMTLVQDFVEQGRSEFTNRELRLDPRVRLPDVSDNLEGRLLLLSRRLVERDACVRIEKTGRGRFKLVVCRPVRLQVGQAPASAPAPAA